MTLCLMQSYGLTGRMKTITCYPATQDELESFHSKEYLEYCQQASEAEDQEKFELEAEEGSRYIICEFDKISIVKEYWDGCIYTGCAAGRGRLPALAVDVVIPFV